MNTKELFLIFTILPSFVYSRTYLRAAAKGTSNVYDLINSVLGKSACSEMPDCSHPAFGPHVYQGNDIELKKQVFFFAAHSKIDNDRCRNFDRQRTEIRPDQGDLTAVNEEAMSTSWLFKLPDGFQPSKSFTHLSQIKAVGGDDTMPLITMTPRRQSSGNTLELIYINSEHQTTKLKVVKLAPFINTWIKAKVRVTFGKKGVGKYSCSLSVYSSGKILLTYSNADMEMWRSGAGYYRAKWGIYRSLENRDELRDEIVRFNDFCISKGEPECT